MQIRILRQDLKYSYSNSNHSKSIETIRKGFEAFECKFEPFERDSKHSDAHSNRSKWIQKIPIEIGTIQKGFEALECKF